MLKCFLSVGHPQYYRFSSKCMKFIFVYETKWELHIHINSFTSAHFKYFLSQTATVLSNSDFLTRQTEIWPFPRLLTNTLNMWPMLPGGEPEDSGDETRRQVIDTGLGRRPTQCPLWAAKLWFLLLLPEFSAVECLQQLHGLDSKSTLFKFYVTASFLTIIFYSFYLC